MTHVGIRRRETGNIEPISYGIFCVCVRYMTHVVLFCRETGMSCRGAENTQNIENIPYFTFYVVCRNDAWAMHCSFRQLFCSKIGLFCGEIELFCGEIGLFCSKIGSFVERLGSFVERLGSCVDR